MAGGAKLLRMISLASIQHPWEKLSLKHVAKSVHAEFCKQAKKQSDHTSYSWYCLTRSAMSQSHSDACLQPRLQASNDKGWVTAKVAVKPTDSQIRQT